MCFVPHCALVGRIGYNKYNSREEEIYNILEEGEARHSIEKFRLVPDRSSHWDYSFNPRLARYPSVWVGKIPSEIYPWYLRHNQITYLIRTRLNLAP